MFQNFSFIKKNVEEASKTENSQDKLVNIREIHDIRELSLRTLVLALHCCPGEKKKTRTSFKSLVLKKARTWALKKTYW